MIIGHHDTRQRVLIVAEIGNNHEGRFEVAQELVDRAAAAGADAVKFQTFRAEQAVGMADAARYARMKRFELSPEQFAALADQAHARGLLFLSTPLDLPSVACLARIADAIKIASADNDFLFLLEAAAASGKPLIVSCGLSNLDELARTVGVIERVWKANGVDGALALLHCVSGYPVPPTQANLRAITALAQRFPYPIGYSDHTVGIEAAVLAVAVGARIIEKHVTLDHQYSEFRDHELSADPAELPELVQRIRAAEGMLGRPVKEPQPVEASGRMALRRSVVAARDLSIGHTIALDDLTWLRPGGGLPPGRERDLIGRRLKRTIASNEPLTLADVEP